MILLVDGNNLLYSASCAAPLRSSDGHPTQGIYYFLNSLFSVTRDFGVKKIFVAWDNGRSRARLELYPEYKASRNKPKTPQQEQQAADFRQSIAPAKEAAALLGTVQIEGQNVEGDDAIAILVQSCKDKGKQSMVLSSDKDFLQLVDPLCSVYRATETGKKARHITCRNMEAEYGLPASRWLEYRALTGDTGDNLPGVSGIGEKTALAILGAYPTVADFIRQPAKLTRKNLEKALLKEDRQAEFETFKRMINLRDLCCNDLGSIRITPGNVDMGRFTGFCQRFELYSIISQLPVWRTYFHN